MNNILFFGTYQHKVDSKGRVSIPAKWRKHLINNELFIFENRLTNFCYKDLSKLTQKDLEFVNKYNLDKQGRITSKQHERSATMKGYGDYFTIEFN